MRRYLQRCLTSTLFGTVLASSIAWTPIPLKAFQDRDRVYHDREHHDDHHWNENEDKAYRRYLEERHETYRAFEKRKAKQQQEYWRWRHAHPDQG